MGLRNRTGQTIGIIIWTKRVAIVALTASVVGEVWAKYKSTGIDGYASQPFQEEELIEQLTKWYGLTSQIWLPSKNLSNYLFSIETNPNFPVVRIPVQQQSTNQREKRDLPFISSYKGKSPDLQTGLSTLHQRIGWTFTRNYGNGYLWWKETVRSSAQWACS